MRAWKFSFGGVLSVELKVGLDDGAKAILFDGQPVVGPGVQTGKDVDPVFVGCSRGRDVGVEVGGRAFGPGDLCAAYVRYPAGDTCAFCFARRPSQMSQRVPVRVGLSWKNLSVVLLCFNFANGGLAALWHILWPVACCTFENL